MPPAALRAERGGNHLREVACVLRSVRQPRGPREGLRARQSRWHHWRGLGPSRAGGRQGSPPGRGAAAHRRGHPRMFQGGARGGDPVCQGGGPTGGRVEARARPAEPGRGRPEEGKGQEAAGRGVRRIREVAGNLRARELGGHAEEGGGRTALGDGHQRRQGSGHRLGERRARRAAARQGAAAQGARGFGPRLRQIRGALRQGGQGAEADAEGRHRARRRAEAGDARGA
mmetsp:Transcript_49862/g.145014  ORF Transcript_49862/g.145014 Transcript_49862/m.145014 type:complete len:229 (-) Transcript_49862:1585-2271(-)